MAREEQQPPETPAGSKTRPRRRKSTPRHKSKLRSEKFFVVKWQTLRENVLKGILLACGDQEGFDYDVGTVLLMDREGVLSEVEYFVGELKMNFPWAEDIEEWLGLGDNRECLQWDAEDDAQLQATIAMFAEKIRKEKEATSAASPASRAKRMVSRRIVQPLEEATDAPESSASGARKSPRKKVRKDDAPKQVEDDAAAAAGEDRAAKSF